MRILVVRLSALGDIVHTLPALTDLRRAFPQAVIDVATDERFVDIPAMHSGVDRVIGLALKRWKKTLGSRQTWQELRHAIGALRSQRYDLVVDVHGLNKSAIVTWLARSQLKVGMSREFCGEWMGPWIYDRACTLEDRRSRIFWIRTVVAKAMERQVEGEVDFSLRVRWQGQQARRIALIHGTADIHRLWPEDDWVGLGRFLVAQGHELVLPWGNAQEKERAQRLVTAIDPAHCQLGPAMSVAGWAQALSQCRMVIGLDTGLTHIAAAIGVPCLGIFNLTDPALLTAQPPAPLETTGGHGRQSRLDEVQAAAERLLGRGI